MILKMCARCKKMIAYPATYCEECKDIADKNRQERENTQKKRSNRAYDRNTRDKKTAAFYHSPEWRALSKKYMQDHGYKCERCGRIATQIHHQTEIKTPEGWDKRLDYDGLEALCDRCHNQEHGRFTKNIRGGKSTELRHPGGG